jgi:hypothetical protein
LVKRQKWFELGDRKRTGKRNCRWTGHHSELRPVTAPSMTDNDGYRSRPIIEDRRGNR